MPILPPAQCGPVSVPVTASGEALGIFLAAATLVAPLPQVFALVRTRSSEGLAPMTMAIALIYGVVNLLGTLIVKWRTVVACGGALGLGGCAVQLLDGLQQLASALALTGLLLLIVSLPPQRTRRNRALAAATLIGLAALCGAVVAVSATWPCESQSLTLSQWLTVLSSLCVLVAFVPQLHTTWRSRGRGSVSYLYFAIQAAGCVLVLGNQIATLRDSWIVWLPVAASGVMQLSIVVVGLAFLHCDGYCAGRCRRRRRGPAEAEGGAAASALDASLLE